MNEFREGFSPLEPSADIERIFENLLDSWKNRQLETKEFIVLAIEILTVLIHREKLSASSHLSEHLNS